MAEPLVKRVESPEQEALTTLRGLRGLTREETDLNIDRLELWMVGNLLLQDIKTDHEFTPGLVSRTVFMPAGVYVTSYTHKVEHQFAILSGSCYVFNAGDGEINYYSAPYVGTTKPGARRVLWIEEDCLWTTFHPSSSTTVEEFEAEVFESRKLLGDMTAHDLHLSITSEIRQLIEEGARP